MQIGQDRSGFYSYTFLENLAGCDMPRVERLVPQWKPRTMGETVWFATPKRFNGQGRMIAAVVEPQQSFVMVSAKDWERLQAGGRAQESFWSFTLESLGDGQSRLIARAWWNAADACVAGSGQIVLGADAFHHGAEDAAHNQRSVGA
jgi:hypothetical protein